MKNIVWILVLLFLSPCFAKHKPAIMIAPQQKKVKKDSVGDLNKQHSPNAIKKRRNRDQMQLRQKRRYEKQADSIRKVQELYDKHFPKE